MTNGPRTFVHPSAEVDPAAIIGAGTKIWHNAQVLVGATIGDDCILGKGVYVDGGVQIGSRVKIQNYALLYRGTVIEDEVFVGPAAICANDRFPRATTPEGGPKSDADWKLEGVTIHRGASVGSASVLLPGVSIGEWAMTAAGAIVTRDVPAHDLVAGNPARSIGAVCRCGHVLDRTTLQCSSCGRSYVSGPAGIKESDG